MRLFRNQRGFTLIELVVTLILVGIIGAFTGLFLSTGIQGFLTSKDISETALKAQIALDRISAELRFIETLPVAPVSNTSVTYTSRDLPDQRSISFDSTSKAISITVGNSSNVLLNNVKSFNLGLTVKDLDNSGDGNNEVAAISIGFTTTEIGTPFSVRIYPRDMLPAP